MSLWLKTMENKRIPKTIGYCIANKCSLAHTARSLKETLKMHNEDCWTHISRNTIIIHCIKQTLQELVVNLWCCFKASKIFCLILVADDLASYYIRKHLFIKEPNLSFIYPYFLLLMKSVFSKTISSTTFLDLVGNKSNYFIFILYLFLFF